MVDICVIYSMILWYTWFSEAASYLVLSGHASHHSGWWLEFKMRRSLAAVRQSTSCIAYRGLLLKLWSSSYSSSSSNDIQWGWRKTKFHVLSQHRSWARNVEAIQQGLFFYWSEANCQDWDHRRHGAVNVHLWFINVGPPPSFTLNRLKATIRVNIIYNDLIFHWHSLTGSQFAAWGLGSTHTLGVSLVSAAVGGMCSTWVKFSDVVAGAPECLIFGESDSRKMEFSWWSKLRKTNSEMDRTWFVWK